MWWLTVPLHCDDVFLGGLVGSQCSWPWVIFGRRERLHFPVSYMLAWSPCWVGAHGGPWRIGWTCCLLVTSLGVWLFNCYHNHIKQIDTCFPYLMWLGIFLLGLWLFAACGRWSWWTMCWCIVQAVSLVVPPVSLAISSWWTCSSFLFGACGPWRLPLIEAGSC